MKVELRAVSISGKCLILCSMASLSKVIFLIWGLVRSWKLLETPVFQKVVDIAMLFCMGVKTCQFGTYCSKDRIFDALRLLWQFLSSSLVYLFFLFVLFLVICLFVCFVVVVLVFGSCLLDCFFVKFFFEEISFSFFSFNQFCF